VYRIILILLFIAGCDKEHRKKCEWYLMPDVERYDEAQREQAQSQTPLDVKEDRRIGPVGSFLVQPKIDDGNIPVCARNFVINKQDCRLQTTLEFAEKAYNKKFKLDDLKTKGMGNPRTIEKIKFCE
jgi:hypothetical protein